MSVYNRIASAIEQRMVDDGYPESLVSYQSNIAVEAIIRELGGNNIYLPTKNIDQRNDGIRSEFNGRNLKEIQRKYNIRRSSVYRICSRR